MEWAVLFSEYLIIFTEFTVNYPVISADIIDIRQKY